MPGWKPYRPLQRSGAQGWLKRCTLHLALLLACWGGWATNANAQNQYALKKGNEAYEQMAYLEAIKYLEKALSKGFDKNGLLRLADSYRLTENPRKAAETYSKVVSLNQIPPLNYFHYAQALMNLGLYPEAAKWFDKYAKAVPADPRGESFAASCRTIGSYFSDTSEIELQPFPHNTKLDDFSPVWYKDGILFSSSRGDLGVIDARYEWNGQPFLDLYYSKVSAAGDKFGRPALVKGKLNTRFHEATCAWDSVNGIAFFTRNNFFEGKKTADEAGIMNLKLFYADVPATGPWTNVRSLPFNSDVYSTGHPAVMAGGNTLLFISDCPGGFGGTDIYRSDFTEEGWSPPVNLGAQVNGPGNEMFPYLTPKGKLYFSSDGQGGLGGLDIFVCDLKTPSSKPQNLGAPINGPADDFGFLVSADRSWGMFSSNRTGGTGADDIYVFHYRKPSWNAVVLDATTREPISNAEIMLELPEFQNRETGSTDSNGSFSTLVQKDRTYQVMASATQYRSKRMEFKTYGARAEDQLRDTILLERPSVIVVTKVLDLSTGFPIANAKVRIVGSNVELVSDSTGQVMFYYDPFPDYEKKPVDCPPEPVGEYCFRFNDDGIQDFDTLQLIYEWSFGDGTASRELEPRHCYAGPGTYHVELNLLDPAGQLMMNQATYDLEVRPPSGMVIDGPDTVAVGSKVVFSGAKATLDGCNIDRYQWELSSGETFSGLLMSHTFEKKGLYKLRLNVSGSGDQAPKACGGCVTKQVVVMDARWHRPSRDSLMRAWSGKPTPPPANIECERQAPETYCYNFVDEGLLSVDTLPFIYLWDLGDGTQMTGTSVTHCYAQPGDYNVRLDLLDPLSKRLVSEVTEYQLEVRDLRQVYIESYDTVAVGKQFSLDAFKSDAPGCDVRSVYWDLGDGTVSAGPVIQHAYKGRGTYRVQMVLQGSNSTTGEPCSRCSWKEVHAYPNYKGNEVRDSLQALSSLDGPAKVMPDGTILLEIAKEGYAPRKVSFDPGVDGGVFRDSILLEPIVPEAEVVVQIQDLVSKMALRDCHISLRDPKTGLEIAHYTSETGTMKLPLEPGKTYSLLISKEGYFNAEEVVGPIQKGKTAVRLHVDLKPAVVGSSWILHNIYYDFDQYFIRNDAAVELEKLLGFLKANPTLTVELGSHTDVRGSDDYNLILSQNRAEAAVEYLEARGIAPGRIVARGYGELRLSNHCKDGVSCSEQLHQENRRTEITVLGFKNPILSQARKVEDIWGTESLSIPSSPAFSGPFTILVGTYVHEKPTPFFDPLKPRFSVTGDKVDGFWEYYAGNYPTYDSAKQNLPFVIEAGYAYADILARPEYTLPGVAAAKPKKPATPVGQVADPNTEVFYSVQVAVVGRTVQDQFYDSFGDYRNSLFSKQIGGQHVYFIGKYGTEQEAVKHLTKIRRTGHSDAFLVHFDRGKKVMLDKIGAH